MGSKINIGRRLVGLFENTMLDPDKIMDWVGIPKNKEKRAELRELALQIRKDTYGDRWGNGWDNK
jgi:hypothetical protein